MNPNDPRPRNLFPVLYEELRQLAQKKLDGLKLGNTLTPTALVHEAFVKMATYGQFSDPAHFYRCSALAMQQILVDQARMKIAEKRGELITTGCLLKKTSWKRPAILTPSWRWMMR